MARNPAPTRTPEPDHPGSRGFRTLLFLTLLLAADVCRASADRWEPFPPGTGGPWGGTVYRIVLSDPGNPDSAWAGTAGGVYRWEQTHWTAAGFSGVPVLDLALCGGSPPEELWAALGEQGLWVSRDGGATWERGFPGTGPVKRVAASPDCSVVWAAEEQSTGDRIWRWTAEAGWRPGGGLATVVRLAPGAAGSGWIGTLDGMYRWGLEEAVPNLLDSMGGVQDLAVRDDHIAVAAGARGLWVSGDAGVTWTAVDVPLGEFETVDTVGLAPDGRILGWIGGDPGRLLEWLPSGDMEEPEPPEPGWLPLSFALSTKGDWAGTAKAGVYWRTDGGGFSPRSRGLAACWPSALAFDPTGSGSLAVAGGESGRGVAGLWVWDPADSDWRRVSGTGASHAVWVGYRGDELWAALSGKGPARIDESGRPEVRAGGVPVSEVKYPGCVLPVPGEPDRLVAAFLCTVYVTDTAGGVWERPPQALPETAQTPWAIVWDPGGKRMLAAGQDAGEGVLYQSRDGGLTWTSWSRLNQPLIALGVAARDPEGGIFVGRPDGLWVRREEWISITSIPQGNVPTIALDDRPGPAVVAAVVEGHGVYLSADGGQTWNALPREGLAPEGDGVPRVTALAFEPGTGRLVAGVEGRGLLYLDVAEPLAVRGSVWVEEADATGAVLGCSTPAADRLGWSPDGSEWVWTDLPETCGVAIPLPEGDGDLVVFVRFRRGTDESPTYQVLVRRPDTTPPVPRLEGLAETVPAGEPVVLTVSGEDVVAYRYRLDGSPFPEEWTARTVPLELGRLAEGEHTLEVEVRDDAGNRAALTLVFTVVPADGPPPSGGGEPASEGSSPPSGGGGGGGCFLGVLGGTE